MTLDCLRCGHKWTRNGEPPASCPCCKNYNYDTPKDARRFKSSRVGLNQLDGIREPKSLKALSKMMGGFRFGIDKPTMDKLNEKHAWITPTDGDRK